MKYPKEYRDANPGPQYGNLYWKSPVFQTMYQMLGT